jgi:hypothetical protein
MEEELINKRIVEIQESIPTASPEQLTEYISELTEIFGKIEKSLADFSIETIK